MPKAECDCCGKNAILSRGFFMGIETYSCEECRGNEPDAYGDEDEE